MSRNNPGPWCSLSSQENLLSRYIFEMINGKSFIFATENGLKMVMLGFGLGFSIFIMMYIPRL